MYNILICDDEIPTCSYIEQVLVDYGEIKKLNINIEVFYDGETALEFLGNNSTIDLIFLDIELPDKNGALIGQEIRNNLMNESIQIVYISSKEKYAMSLFQVRPFDFLIKPLSEKIIICIFEKYRSIYDNQQRFFEYKTGKSYQKILFSDIMYFVCEKRKICIVTRKETIPFYGNMKELHETLSHEDFWSIHISYIINIRYVRLFRDNEVVMCNDQVIPISTAYKKEVQKKLFDLQGIESYELT